MARRILFKEGGLTGSVPSGFKAFGIETQINRNSAPTDGVSNTNYQSLISKGWNVRISKA